MARLIDAVALRKNLSSRYMNELYPDWLNLPAEIKMRIEILAKEFRFALDHAPTIDAVPVVHARWEYNPGDNIPYCSRCAMPQDVQTKYCHNCGAKMRGETDEE